MTEIEKAIQLKNELDALRPIGKEQEAIIMQKFHLDWNYHSNHLEGNSLTYGETKALLLHGITAQGKPLKDHFEITGHAEAIKWVEDIVKGDMPLSENFIRELHQLLLKEPYEVDAITPEGLPTKKRVAVGQYKTSSNHVKTKTGEIFRFASKEETPALMNDLINWVRDKTEQKDVNPIILAAEFHYKFIRIHPFDDGNGRTARILMNFILMRFGYPPAIIRTEDKGNYLSALQIADGGLIEPFVNYIAANVVKSLEIMIAGAKGEEIEEPNDLKKEIALLEQKVKSLGKKSNTAKSTEIIIETFENSILKLVDKLKESSNMFDNFYVSNKCQIEIEDESEDFRGDNFISTHGPEEFAEITNYISEYTIRITIINEHNLFKSIGYGAFDYRSVTDILFKKISYVVETMNSRTEHGYDDSLTNEEINGICKIVAKNHKQFIELKIQEEEDRKNAF